MRLTRIRTWIIINFWVRSTEVAPGERPSLSSCPSMLYAAKPHGRLSRPRRVPRLSAFGPAGFDPSDCPNTSPNGPCTPAGSSSTVQPRKEKRTYTSLRDVAERQPIGDTRR